MSGQPEEESKLEGNLANYGSTGTEEGKKSSKDLYHDKIYEWGGPLPLLMKSWIELGPIIGPLLLISLLTCFMGQNFNVACDTFQQSDPKRMICEVTGPCVFMFPAFARFAVLFLVTWRFVRQRLFYVFLQQGILIDFENFSNFAGKVLITEVVLFAMACVHFCLLIEYGLQPPDPEHPGVDSMPILTTNIGTLLKNPLLLMKPENHSLIEFVLKISVGYLCPAFLAILCSFSLDDAEVSLVPLIKLYEAGPVYVHYRLSETIAVGEGVARKILDCHKVEEDATSSKALLDKPNDVSEACNIFQKEALRFDGVGRIGNHQDMESGSPFGSKALTLTPITLHDLGSRPWWPMKIILKDDVSLSAVNAFQFRQVWVIHCSMVFVLIVADLVMRFYMLYQAWTHLAASSGENHTMCAQSFVTYVVISVVFATLWISTLRILAANIHEQM